MPIETNLNVSPYFDDFSPEKNYYKVLFRPGVALQARELSQVQSILQDQIEKFGDHIFKSGTIISGVNFRYNFKYNYVKILDLQTDGQPVVPAAYVGLLARNSNNLIAQIVNHKDGFQARDPDTNYLYLKYINAGVNGNTSTFTVDDVLTIYGDSYQLYDFNVINGGVGFSNSDAVQITSALLVANSTLNAGVNASQTIGSNTANVYVIEANTTFGSIKVGNTTYTSGEGYTILRVKPINTDLANTSLTSAKWNILANNSLVQGSNTANVLGVIGAGATAVLTTDGSGIVTDVSLVSPGSNYDVLPYVTIRTATGTLTNLDIQAQNYKAQVTVAGASYTTGNTTPVGNGYAFSVTEGIVFHKGHFVRVSPQTIIVNAYSSNVDGVTVGFETVESIVNSSVDTTLLDIATGTPNFNAPGANRLKLTPTLKVVNTDVASSNNAFLPLVEFNEGEPGREFNFTKYNHIAKEFERRTSETAGNFVIDPFTLSTREKTTANNDYIDIVVDPGLAYINGRRIGTRQNVYLPLRKGTDTKVNDPRTISLNYGNFVYVDELAGSFDFKVGGEVTLYPSPKNYISGATSPGTSIGTARIRSLVLDTGTPGTPTGKYRMYLFDIRMNSGKSFRDVRSIISASPEAYADTVLESNPSTGVSETVLHDNKFSTLIFNTGLAALKSANAVSYSYRTTATANISTSGIVAVTVSGDDTITYGSNVSLNSVQKRDLVIVPTTNAVSSANQTISVTSGSNVITGTALSSVYDEGDYIRITNGANVLSYRVDTVIDVNTLRLNSAYSNTTNATADGSRFFPALLPIPFTSPLTTRTANTNGTGTTLTVDIGTGLVSQVETKFTYNVTRSGSAQIQKDTKRNLFVKISLANNVAGTTGPWCLGIPDAFRLNNVYVGSNSSVNTSSTNVTRYFFADNGQKDGYFNHSHLIKNNNNDFVLSGSEWLLVDIDAFTTSSEGYMTVSSYTLASNNNSRDSLGNTAINVLEIPEFLSSQNRYYDLRDTVDFRPRISNTAVYTSTAASATVNPVNTITFNSNDKLFPVPDSTFTAVYEQYLPRIDIVVLDTNGDMSVVQGTASDINRIVPSLPGGSIALGGMSVTPYPTVAKVPTANTIEFIAKSIGTTKPINTRVRLYTVGERELRSSGHQQQNRRYTMSDIGNIERRLESLEYYTSLNQLEQRTKDKVIPSGIDGSNRFKNGFFVEQFIDYRQADTSDPEFNCYVDQINYKLYPPDSTYNIQARFDYTDTNVQNDVVNDTDLIEPGVDKFSENTLLLPFNEETVINQDRFTSKVGSDGTNIKFIGNMTINPPRFNVVIKAEVRLTDGVSQPSSQGGIGRGSSV